MSGNPVALAAGEYAIALDQAAAAGERLKETMRAVDCDFPCLFDHANHTAAHTAAFVRELLLKIAAEEAQHILETDCDGC